MRGVRLQSDLTNNVNTSSPRQLALAVQLTYLRLPCSSSTSSPKMSLQTAVPQQPSEGPDIGALIGTVFANLDELSVAQYVTGVNLC
jgi:hypothetical protein